jgi:hypothetical protein
MEPHNDVESDWHAPANRDGVSHWHAPADRDGTSHRNVGSHRLVVTDSLTSAHHSRPHTTIADAKWPNLLVRSDPNGIPECGKDHRYLSCRHGAPGLAQSACDLLLRTSYCTLQRHYRMVAKYKT